MKLDEVVVAPHREVRIDAGDVQRLFQSEKWWPERSPSDLQLVIEAGPAVGAWVGRRLVGFVRAVTDGHFRAYVEDCVVAEDCRRLGVGNELVSVLMRDLAGIDVVSLFCSSTHVSVYERSGFAATSQIVMHRSKGS